MPLPTEVELRVQASPVPTQTVLSSLGSMARAPIDCTGCLSKTGLKVVPPSSDFHTPPEAAPTYTVVVPFLLEPATAAMRPLMVAEPMLRAPRPEMTPWSTDGGPPSGAGWGALGVAAAPVPSTATRVTALGSLGKRKTASSISTLGSARSMLMRTFLGPSLGPASMAKGNQTPLTCS